MPVSIDLSGELALVTGASRGIGRAIAEALAGAGAVVIGTATTAAGARVVTERMEAAGWKGRGLVLDVSRPDDVTTAQKDIESHEGAVTILVNNAGITRDNLVMRMRDEEWDSVVATNLSATFRVSRAFLRGMLKLRRGRIVNISSVVGAMGNAGQANYAAAKAGLVGLSKSLAREVGSRGITVNVVAPGFIATDMTAALSEEQRQALMSQIPLQRLGEAADVAGAVVFLASPAGAYITGETLHVNGGMYMI
jgi:3-oxoacyl-[acyl-carrier protein] reductase